MENQERKIATLAGGCFWGLEELFRTQDGVSKTEVGYSGGQTENPTYSTVSQGNTGHAEALQIEFDSQKISFAELLRFFFKIHDPTTKNRQGNDRGSQYRSVIFFHDDHQETIAKEVIEEIENSGNWPAPLVTELVKFNAFYSAEEEHQKYLERNPGGYTCHFIRSF